MDYGGAEVRTLEVMERLREQGVRFDFCGLLRGAGVLDGRVRALGGEVYSCPLRPGIGSFGKRFLRLLSEHRPDVVHSHVHYFGGNVLRLAARAGVCSRIVHFRSTGDGKALTVGRRVYRGVMRRMINRYATGILAVSRGAMDYGWGADWEKDSRAAVIYNGINLEAYGRPAEKEAVRKELGIDPSTPVITYVARIRPEKGHAVLLKAVQALSSEREGIHFLIVGDGAERGALEQQARELGIGEAVHFLGTREDVPRLLLASDAFVSPSFREGLPGAILEAVAAGLPVVATDLPGVQEVAAYTDLVRIVPVGDAPALARGMREAIERGRIAGGGVEVFPKEFDLSHCADTLIRYYERQLEGTRQTGAAME